MSDFLREICTLHCQTNINKSLIRYVRLIIKTDIKLMLRDSATRGFILFFASCSIGEWGHRLTSQKMFQEDVLTTFLPIFILFFALDENRKVEEVLIQFAKRSPHGAHANAKHQFSIRKEIQLKTFHFRCAHSTFWLSFVHPAPSFPLKNRKRKSLWSPTLP